MSAVVPWIMTLAFFYWATRGIAWLLKKWWDS